MKEETKCAQCKFYAGGQFVEIDHDVGQFMWRAQCNRPFNLFCPTDESGCDEFKQKGGNND